MTSLKLERNSAGSLGLNTHSLRASVERGTPGHGNGYISGVLEDELADLNTDFPDPKFPQKMGGQLVGKGFEKFGSLSGQKCFRFPT